MLHILEPDNPDYALITDKRSSGEHVIESLFVQPYGTTVTVSEANTAIAENMKTVPVAAALTFPEASPWCVPIPETAHRVGIFFNFIIDDAMSMPSDIAAFTLHTFLLGCIKTGTTIIPVAVLDPINTIKPASSCTVFTDQSTLYPCYCSYDGSAVIPTHLISAEVPAGISHIAVIKRLKDITANPLPTGTLKTNIHFW